jgi:hypothetical protein
MTMYKQISPARRLPLAYLDSEYDDFDNASCAGEQLRADNPVAGCDLATKTLDL